MYVCVLYEHEAFLYIDRISHLICSPPVVQFQPVIPARLQHSVFKYSRHTKLNENARRHIKVKTTKLKTKAKRMLENELT